MTEYKKAEPVFCQIIDCLSKFLGNFGKQRIVIHISGAKIMTELVKFYCSFYWVNIKFFIYYIVIVYIRVYTKNKFVINLTF